MRSSKRWLIPGELRHLSCLTKYWWKEGYRRARSQATTRQRESVLIVVDCVRSNRNEITCLFWSCSRIKILAAKADFPTPGDPLTQIILWPSTLLTSDSIACRMSLRVSFIHGSCSSSFFPPRVLTKSSSSFFSATSFWVSDIRFSINEF